MPTKKRTLAREIVEHPPIVPGEMVVTDPLQEQVERHRQIEMGMAQGKRQFAECLRAIVQERTYRSEGFESLEDYMNIRWASSQNFGYCENFFPQLYNPSLAP